jgi:hypothetical protein
VSRGAPVKFAGASDGRPALRQLIRSIERSLTMSRLSVLFTSHGAPTYALAPGVAELQLTAIGPLAAEAEGCAGGVTALDDVNRASRYGAATEDHP